MSLRKSSSRRKGSNSDGSPKPNARRRCTPAPSSVSLERTSRLTGRMDMEASYGIIISAASRLHQRGGGGTHMCRNIKPLFNFDPPVTDEEIRDASLQFVRKISGFTRPSKANEAAFEAAVEQIAQVAHTLLAPVVTQAAPRHRETQAGKARETSGRPVAAPCIPPPPLVLPPHLRRAPGPAVGLLRPIRVPQQLA